MYPIMRNMICDFRYLYGSLNLYSAQIDDEEYIINKPNNEIIMTLINIWKKKEIDNTISFSIFVYNNFKLIKLIRWYNEKIR